MPKDFSTIITKVKSQNPDIIIMGSLYNETAMFIKQAHRDNYKPQIGGPTPLLAKSLVNLAGEDASGIMTVGSFSTNLDNERVKNFVKEYKEKYNEDPSSFSAYSFDATNILIEAIKKAGADKVKVNEKLNNFGTFSGITGDTTFDKNGDAKKKLIRFVVKEGKFLEWKK